MVEVIVAKLGHDGQQKMFVVILQERGGGRLLPIWIGRPEAEATSNATSCHSSRGDSLSRPSMMAIRSPS